MSAFRSFRAVHGLVALSLFGVSGVLACARPTNVNVQLARNVPSGEGVVVVMDPMSCSVNRDVLAMLDSMSRIAGITTSGVLLRMPPSRQDRDAVVAAIDVNFPVRWDSTSELVSGINAAGYTLPIIAVVSRGKLETVAWGHAFHAIAMDVAKHYTGFRSSDSVANPTTRKTI